MEKNILINDIKEPENFEVQGVTSDGLVDFYITIAENGFVGDFFTKNVQSKDEAYIESLSFESDILEVVIKEAQNYVASQN